MYTAKEVITSNKDNQVVHESKIFALKQVTHLSAKVCVISVCVMCACVHVCIGVFRIQNRRWHCKILNH